MDKLVADRADRRTRRPRLLAAPAVVFAVANSERTRPKHKPLEAESKIKEAGLVPAFTIDDRGNLFCSVRVGAGARIGLDVDAPDETAAMEKAAEEFKVPATRLMTIRRS